MVSGPKMSAAWSATRSSIVGKALPELHVDRIKRLIKLNGVVRRYLHAYDEGSHTQNVFLKQLRELSLPHSKISHAVNEKGGH